MTLYITGASCAKYLKSIYAVIVINLCYTKTEPDKSNMVRGFRQCGLNECLREH